MTAALPEDLERDVRLLLRQLRAHGHVEAFLVSVYGRLRVRSVGRDCERVGRYVVRGGDEYDVGEVIRGDVEHAVEQAIDKQGRASWNR